MNEITSTNFFQMLVIANKEPLPAAALILLRSLIAIWISGSEFSTICFYTLLNMGLSINHVDIEGERFTKCPYCFIIFI